MPSKTTSQENKNKEIPEIIWVKAQVAATLLYEENPMLHDLEGIKKSIQRYGWQELPKYDDTLGAIKAGNGRVEAVAQMESEGSWNLPRGLSVDDRTGEWVIPVLSGVDAQNIMEAKGYLIDSNNLTALGGNFNAIDASQLYDQESYMKLLEGMDSLPVSLDDEDFDILKDSLQSDENDEDGVEEDRYDNDELEESPEDKEDDYLNSDVRQFVVIVPDENHDEVLERLTQIKEQNDLETNSDVFLHAIWNCQ